MVTSVNRLTPTLALTLALASPGASAELSNAELGRQLAYSAVHLADWAQTRTIAADPARWHERNPILGPHPRAVEVNRYFAATLAAHWAITCSLPPSWRKPWQEGTFVLELAIVHRNARLGIAMQW